MMDNPYPAGDALPWLEACRIGVQFREEGAQQIRGLSATAGQPVRKISERGVLRAQPRGGRRLLSPGLRPVSKGGRVPAPTAYHAHFERDTGEREPTCATTIRRARSQLSSASAREYGSDRRRITPQLQALGHFDEIVPSGRGSRLGHVSVVDVAPLGGAEGAENATACALEFPCACCPLFDPAPSGWKNVKS